MPVLFNMLSRLVRGFLPRNKHLLISSAVICMDVRVGLYRKLSAEELMLLNCGVGEDCWESFGLQGDPTSPSYRKSVLNIHFKGWCWSWSSNPFATRCKELTHWKRPWCWERLTEGGEGDDRGWDGWMASPTQRTWVWANSRRWWRTQRPGVLQSMGLDTTERLNWTRSLRQWMFLTLLGFWGLGSESGFVGWLWIKCLFSHLKADDSGESASRFHLVVTSVHPQLSAKDPGASLMGQSQQGRAAGVPRSEAGRERTGQKLQPRLTRSRGWQTSTIGHTDQPGHKVGATRLQVHTAGTGLWGHLGGWLHTVFLLRTLAEGVRWDQGLPGGLDAFASGDSGGTPWSEQGATGPSRSKGPTFYHGHHFRSSLGTFGGNGSSNFGCVTPPGVSCCITKLSV